MHVGEQVGAGGEGNCPGSRADDGLDDIVDMVDHRNFIGEKLLTSWRQLGEILLIAAVADLAVLSNNPLLLYPLALLSALTVMVLLSMIYAMVWVMLSKSENRFASLRGLSTVLVAGFATALSQIAVMDIARYLLTGTWKGFFS